MCLSAVIRNAVLFCVFLAVQLLLFAYMHFLFVLIGARTHTHTLVLLHKFVAVLFPLIHSFRRFFFSFVLVLLWDLILFSPFYRLVSFHRFHHSIIIRYKIHMHTHTHARRCYTPKNLFLADAVARIKSDHLQMLKRNVLIYWNLDTKSIKNEKNDFLHFKQTQIILFYRFFFVKKKELRSKSFLI